MTTLKVGSTGPKVVEWQMFLKQAGFFTAGVAPVFGPKTYAATKAFQRTQGIDDDGIVGPVTKSAARRIQNPRKGVTLEEVAQRAGIPTTVLLAIRAVESRGQPHAVRFEPHLFHRKRPDLKDQIPYTASPRGYSLVRTETNRDALEHALTVDPETAIRSTSFGSYQVLGGYLLAAYPGEPVKAYERFNHNPIEASELMVAAWFADNRAAREAANSNPPDFRKLARAYNGPNYGVHKYDERLKAAWRKAQDEEATV